MNLPTRNEEAKINRIGAHSHIKGLGYGADLKPLDESKQCLFGQNNARKAAMIATKLANTTAGRVILLTGKSGTGKTAIAMGMAKTIGSDAPFVSVTGSELYTKNFSKAEALMQSLRKAINVRIRESHTVIEGELLELTVEAIGKTKRGSVILKTTDMESLFNLGPKMLASFEKQNIVSGDIIRINKETGSVIKLGRSFLRSAEYDAINGNITYMPCPSGELQRQVEEIHTVSLHDIDVVNSRAQGFLAIFDGDTGEIQPEVRNQVNLKVAEWREEKKADLTSGVLFIDECHLLDLECFSILNRLIESEFTPLLVMATNRAVAPIKGTNQLAPHGIPVDFLDRALIIPTAEYGEPEVERIIMSRIEAETSSVYWTSEAIHLLVKIAMETRLRYALQLVGVCWESMLDRNGMGGVSVHDASGVGSLSEEGNAGHVRLSAVSHNDAHSRYMEKFVGLTDKVQLADVERGYRLFLDVGRSTEFLKKYDNQYLK